MVPALLNIIVQYSRLMNKLLNIVRSAAPGNGIQFRQETYGKGGIRHFLRDVLAMANAPAGVPSDDFSGKPPYQSLVADFIEVGFPGDIIHKELSIPTTDLSQLPSTLAGAKLNQLMEARSSKHSSGATTVMRALLMLVYSVPTNPIRSVQSRRW